MYSFKYIFSLFSDAKVGCEKGGGFVRIAQSVSQIAFLALLGTFL